MAHSLDTALDRDSDVPLGTQLAWKLRAAMAGGALRPGDRLPPVRELAAAAGVNVNTVRAVYARLAEHGAIVSQHGRGTFVAGRAGAAAAGLGELLERTARDARRHGVDPRELAAVLYARFDAEPEGLTEAVVDADADSRRGLRAEIEALEHELASLEPRLPEEERATGGAASAAPGARLVSARELEATRDDLARRVADRHRRLRETRAAAAASRREQEPEPKRESSPWPELLASRPALG